MESVIRFASSAVIVHLSFIILLGGGTVVAQQGMQGQAAVIAYPALVVRAQPSEKAAVVGEVPFAESAAILYYGGRAARGASGSWARILWNGKEGWAPGAYLVPGAELSAKDVTAEELACCGKKCERVMLKALQTLVKIEPRDLRPSRIPYSMRSLKLERSDGETNCWELVGGMESLVFTPGTVSYSNITGTEGCSDVVVQSGTYSMKGTTVYISLKAGKRTETSCTGDNGKKEESPVRAAGFRLHWISKINGFMTDDDIRSFDFSRTWFSPGAGGFVTYQDGLKAFFCHADDDKVLEGKEDAGCREVFRKLVPERPYRFTGYFRKSAK